MQLQMRIDEILVRRDSRVDNRLKLETKGPRFSLNGVTICGIEETTGRFTCWRGIGVMNREPRSPHGEHTDATATDEEMAVFLVKNNVLIAVCTATIALALLAARQTVKTEMRSLLCYPTLAAQRPYPTDMPVACLCRAVDLPNSDCRVGVVKKLNNCAAKVLAASTLRSSTPPPPETKYNNNIRQRKRSASNTVPPNGAGRFVSEFTLLITPCISTLRTRAKHLIEYKLEIIPVRSEYEGWTNYHDADLPVFKAPWRAVQAANRFVHQRRNTSPAPAPSLYSISNISPGGKQIICTEYEKTTERQRYYPVKGWKAPKLPGDPKHWDRKKEDVKCPPGWEWAGEWYVAGDGEGWVYSFSFSENIRMNRGQENCLDLTRRRRWLRHRVQQTIVTGVQVTPTALLGKTLETAQQNFFAAGKSIVPQAVLGKYAAVCSAIRTALSTSAIPRRERWCPFSGTIKDSFMGRDAVDWMFASRSSEIFQTLPNFGTHGSGSTRPPSSPASPTSPKGLQTRHDAVMLLEKLRLQGILASSAPSRNFFTKIRDDTSLYHFQETKTDAAEVYQEVIAALTPQLQWLSPISFNPESGWFKNVSNSVQKVTQTVDDFASQHRHRWKSKSHQCFHCSDLLVEDGIVRLLCGHTLCKECCKVFLNKQHLYNERMSLDEALGADICDNLLICELCCTPSAIKISQSAIGLTHYEAIRTRLFVYETEIVFENHRRRLASKYNRKYLLVSDRAAFSNADGTVKKPPPDQVELPGPEWHYVEPWHCVTGATTDSSGWQYGFNWRHPDWADAHWSATPTGFNFVRRRKLRRLRINSSGTRYVREQLVHEIERKKKASNHNPTPVPSSPYFLRRESMAPTMG
eukprot:TRINITY_DN30372_c0_g1_i1.p1 TRINITY_DN30372_c0_g1~~TRINITY_DN30372_c0_g1_i1.p1  ORF type:complete len:862 (+),score=44.00 TRINITY_DN30372_c0_g1_i1:53-2638(+)